MEGTNYEFSVRYTIKKSWFTAARKDSMLLYNSTRTNLLTPTEWPLERSSATTGTTGLSTINLNDTLAFSDSNSAVDYFINQNGLGGANPTITKQDFQYFATKETADSKNTPFAGEGGEAFIRFLGTINSAQNKCYQGELALVSKETTYKETPCAVS